MSASASNALAVTVRADEEKSRATGSAAGDVSYTHFSAAGSEADFGATGVSQGTRLMNATGPRMPFTGGPSCCLNLKQGTSLSDLRAVIARLEELQTHPTHKSPHQPTTSKRYLQQRIDAGKIPGNRTTPLEVHSSMAEVERIIDEVTANNPEQRMRLASMTKSGWLRQKILGHVPKGGRMAGGSTLGSSHSWVTHDKRPQFGMRYTDSNWPRSSSTQLPGGDWRHDQLLRCAVEKLPVNPTIDKQPSYSIASEVRWWGCKENGELDKHFQQNRHPPGPGAYHKTAPRGPHFNVDNGETVVLGANHPCPWKSPMGQSINPTNIHVNSEHHSAPKWSFSKTRRSCSDTFLGHGQKSGGPVKSDEGGLSPGIVYEHYSTFGQAPRVKKRSKSTGSKVRVYLVPPEPQPGDGQQEQQDEGYDSGGYY